jgi:pimeloyl-ACP methyl ester carboxylesterase
VSECRERRVPVGATRWKIRELGDPGGGRPTVVMVAGLGSGEYLLPHAVRLAATRYVLLPDMPGFGRTRGPRRLRSIEEFRDALVELLDAQVPLPVDLIGNSFGTQIVIAAAARRPEIVRRVVLIGPTFDVAARSVRRMVPRWLKITPKEPPALALSLARSYAQCGVRTPVLAFRAGLRDAPEERIAKLRQPILLVRGAEDRIAPREWLETLRERAHDAQIAEVPNVAHTVDFAAPEAIAKLTTRFLGDAVGTGVTRP